LPVIILAATLGVAVAVVVAMAVGKPFSTNEVAGTAETDKGAEPDALREQILSSMTEGVILLDSRGTPVYVNPAAGSLIGSATALPRHVVEGDVSEFSVRHPQQRELRATTSPIAESYKLVVIQDVTESRRTDDMRREFVSSVSHELKTPVAGILASAETLEVSAAEDPPSVSRFVGSLLTEARRLSKLVEDLLDLARLEQEAPQFEKVTLSDLVEFEIARVGDFASRKSLSLQAEIKPGVEVMGNTEDLTLAVRNLLVNALRYTEDGGVTARLEAPDGRAVFSVSDTGPGIPAKDLPRIFERFYRVDKARSRETGGTGLGLSIVRHVAERHGGEVRAESELGRGSTFTLSLPLTT
jgi:signal transduction histidine kinase